MSRSNRYWAGIRVCLVTVGLAWVSIAPGSTRAAEQLPNFVILFADDLGYGDLSCYGHPTIHTPALDQMAAEGMRLTQFYSAAPVCTPSRAALMTGRLPIRNGMCADHPRVLFPNSASGLPHSEITLAEALKTKGYATTCIGKWHLGHLPDFLPTRQGFDSYFGIPYSNDMSPTPLLRNEEILEEPAHQETLTKRYTAEAIKFIKANRDKPFFLYLPHTFPHVPLFASDEFKGKSIRGIYGDVLAELDWSTGEILKTLRELELARNTLVIFTSDNGPWLWKGTDGGSAGLLRGGKGSSWEGGIREPCIAWWPGKIKAGAIRHDIASTMDIFATCLTLAGIDLPADRTMDSYDLGPVLFGTGKCGRETMFCYRGTRLMAVRKGPWKMHVMTQDGYGQPEHETHDPPLLFQLEIDPSEKHDVAKDHPDVVADLLAEMERHKAGLEPVECQLTKLLPKKEK